MKRPDAGAGAPGEPDHTSESVDDVVRRVEAATPFVSVVTEGSPSTTWVADVVRLSRAGDDPLAPWRTALRDQQQRINRVAVPAHVPAAFVLQWWCEVVATPIAYAAELGPWVLRPDASAMGFELAPALHPRRIVVLPGGTALEEVQEPEGRASRARAAYDELVRDVATGFAPDVVMGSRQRWGVVDDMWVTARRRAAGAAGRLTGPEPARTSCCFIFVLPGMRECGSCPRHGRPRPPL